MRLCSDQGIQLYELVMDHIRKESFVSLVPNRVLLYHGSKSGLTGAIAPISRDKCDFGRGFYMGTDPVQPLTLICDFEQAKFYVLSIDLTDLSVFEVPPDLDWAMLVAFYRGKMEAIKGTTLYRHYAQMAQGNDVLIGAIANDRMFYVLDNFFLGNITDIALIQSLSALQLGRQYVAINEHACEKIRIEKEVPLSHLERVCLQEVSEQNRSKGVSLANEICKIHRREGRYFDEIMNKAGENV
ncbi:hypothetical protein F260042K2_27380 [Flavonifractor plautii]